MVAVAEPGAIVGCEDDECVVFDIVFAECFDDPPDGPVDFHQDIGEEAFAAAILKAAAGEEWHVDHGVRQVEEERLISAAIDEGGGFLGAESGEFGLIGGGNCGIDDGVIFDQRQVRPAFQSFFHRQLSYFRMEGPHVVAVGQTEVLIEAVLERQEGEMVSEVPFAEAGGGVVFLSADFRECGFVRVDTDAALRSEGSLDTDSDVVAAGQQGGPRSRTDGLSDVEIGEAASSCGEFCEVWCELWVAAEGRWIGVAHIVHENEYDIGLFFGCGEGGGVETGQGGEREAGEFWRCERVVVEESGGRHGVFSLKQTGISCGARDELWQKRPGGQCQGNGCC